MANMTANRYWTGCVVITIESATSRSFSIYTPINRTTARYFIESAFYWIRYAGCAGTAILFDNSRVTVPRNPRDEFRYYTRAMTLEHYELLREFIDSVDKLKGTLLVVVTNQDFLDGSAPGAALAVTESIPPCKLA